MEYEDDDSTSDSSTADEAIYQSGQTLDDKMTELINLQCSNGMFEVSSDESTWDKSVFKFFAGNLQNVKSGCPEGVTLTMWITALAMKILENKIAEKKELWELVVEKSQKYLLKQFAYNEEEYKTLQVSAEKFIMNV